MSPNTALGSIGSPGVVDTIERIELPTPKSSRMTDGLTPIIVVTMKSQGEGTIHIVDLARKLRSDSEPDPHLARLLPLPDQRAYRDVARGLPGWHRHR